MSLSAGTKLGSFEVVSALGAGGMGEVYRARDTRLGRDVAIKVLPPAFAADPDRLRRFEQEARAIAALNHPHICQLYDVGPGYLVLEYVEGEPLHGPMAVDHVVRLALQMASALEMAHQRGILHRDLKPANILVTRDGMAKLLDFGVAKLMGLPDDGAEDLTRTIAGTVVGTAAYMSPEQAEGKPLDARSDIFSFGAVLYELLSGRRAFGGDTSARVVSAVLRDDPPPLQAPQPLERLVSRCLAKQPSQRFQTMANVKTALEQLTAKPADQQPSIAVLPFANMSRDPDDEFFSDGLAEEIINALAHISGLKVIARTSAFAFRNKHEDIRRIADALGVTNVLEGSVRRAGNRLRVTAQLITAADGSHLWSERYDRELADVFAIQDEIAQSIASALQVRLTGKHAHYTPSQPAYEALLRGRYHRQKLESAASRLAEECFQQAIRLDPKYAAAHGELGLTYYLATVNTSSADATMIEYADRIRAAAHRALELDPYESNPHAVLGAVAAARDYNWRLATEHFEKAMGGSSVSADTRWAYACLYLLPLGRSREAVEEMQRSVEQDPLNVAWRAVLGSVLNHAEMYDRARKELLVALELDQNNPTANIVVSETYWATGQFAEAAAAAEKAYAIAPTHSMCWGPFAAALERAGERDRAAALVAKHGDSPRPVWGRVWYHPLCSEIDEAARWYEVMIEQREPFAVMFPNYPVVRSLRASHHWPKLARMMNLPAGYAGAETPALQP